MNEITCYHANNVSKDILDDLKHALESTFQGLVLVEDFQTWELPPEAYHGRRRQYDATLLLEFLLEEEPSKNIKLLITTEDLFVPGMNFVFGLAQTRRGAIVSLHRLDTTDFINKEAIHEIGHVLGLKHCQLPCVMTFSNSVMEARQKSSKLCPKCKKTLGMA